MSGKGGSNKNKRVSLPRVRQILRKAFTWAIRPSAGPHSKSTVIPLAEIVRDKLGLAQNRKETQAILQSRQILVDEKVRTHAQFPVGLFDVVRVEAEKKRFRVVFDSKGRLQLSEMDASEKNWKVARVVKKTVLGKDQMQLGTQDGRTFLEKKTSTRVGDSVVIDLASQKIIQVLPLKEGQTGYITRGTHVGESGKITGLSGGTMQKKALAELKTVLESFQTIRENIVVIGEKEPVVMVDWPGQEETGKRDAA